MSLLIFTIIAFGGLAGVGVAATILHRAKSRRRQRTMDLIAGHPAHKTHHKSENAKDTPDEETAGMTPTNIGAKLKKAAREHTAMNDTKSLSSMIMQAGLNISPLQFYLYSGLFGSAMFALVWSSSAPRLVAILVGVTALLGLPRAFLKFKASRRQRAFLNDFADALEAMIRLLKAGMPVGEAIAMVAREFAGPVGDEMGRVYDTQKVGVPMQDAVRKMIPRMPIPEVQMFATSVAIQIQTGSSLSEVLGNLSGVIRARYRLKRKVQALSAEAKISAMIIGALPIIVSLALWGVNPDYIGLLFTNSTGKMLLTGAIVWMSLGILVMRQMINFKV